jgi:hypothetical protein
LRDFVPRALRAVTLLSLATLPIAVAFGQSALDAKLGDIDRSFVCPESIQGDEARRAAIKQFLEQMTALQPTPSIGQIMDIRAALLRKHNCTKTLQNMESGAQSSEENANIADRSSKDHWHEIGKISGPSSITVSIDADRVVAGPQYLRVWVKYLNDPPDQKNVKEQYVHEKIDCESKSHLAVSIYAYDANRHVVYGGSDETGKPEPIVKGSLLDNVLPFVCTSQKTTR